MGIKHYAVKGILMVHVIAWYSPSIAQNKYLYLPNIGYDYTNLYDRESWDSVENWLYLYGPAMSEVTVKNLIDFCGKDFYQTPDTTLIKKLTPYLPDATNSYYNNPEYLNTVINRLDYVSQNLEAQVWKENNFVLIDSSSVYSTAVRNLPSTKKIHSFNWRYDNHLNTWNSNEYDQITMQIHVINNDSIKAQQLLTFISRLIIVQTDPSYITPLSERLINLCLSSKSLTNLQKAAYIIIDAKLLSMVDNYRLAQHIHSTYNAAKGCLLLDKTNLSYLYTLQIIQANYWNSLPLLYGKLNAMQILAESILAQDRNRWTKSDYFRHLSLMAYFNSCYMKEHFLDYQNYSSQMRLRLINYLSSASMLLTEGIKTDTSLDYYRHIYYRALSDYYEIEMDFKNSAKAQYCALEITFNSPDRQLRLDILDTYTKSTEKHGMADSLFFTHLFGQFSKLEPDNSELQEAYDSLKHNEHLARIISKDMRQWKQEDLEPLKDILEDFNIQYFQDYFSLYHYNQQELSRRTLRMKFLELAKRIKDTDPTTAYKFLARADSLKNDYSLSFFSNAIAYGAYSRMLPEKYFLEANIADLKIQTAFLDSQVHDLSADTADLNKHVREINNTLTAKNRDLEDLNTKIIQKVKRITELSENQSFLEQLSTRKSYIITGLGISIFLLTLAILWALQEKRKAQKARKAAEKSEAKEKIVSLTMRQIGHLLPDIIRSLAFKLDSTKVIIEQAKGEFDKLADTVRKIYILSLDNTEIDASTEIKFVSDLMDMRYGKEGKVKPSELILGSEYLSDIRMPTFILFNLIANAFQHGRLTSGTQNETNTLNIQTLESTSYKEVEFVNRVLTEIKEYTTKTGLEFIQVVLNEWNSGKGNTDFATWREENNGTQLYHVKFKVFKA